MNRWEEERQKQKATLDRIKEHGQLHLNSMLENAYMEGRKDERDELQAQSAALLRATKKRDPKGGR